MQLVYCATVALQVAGISVQSTPGPMLDASSLQALSEVVHAAWSSSSVGALLDAAATSAAYLQAFALLRAPAT